MNNALEGQCTPVVLFRWTCTAICCQEDLKLTHGLILGRDSSGMMKNKDVSIEFPAGCRFEAGVYHHHALPDLAPFHL